MGYRNGERSMSNVILREVDESTSDFNLSMRHTTLLSDMKQIIVDTFNYEHTWNGSGYNSIKKEPMKVIVKELHYSLSWATHTFELDTIVVLGFRKDNKVKAREDYFHKHSFSKDQYQDVLPQIPDSFHDEARNEFLKMSQKMFDSINEIKNKGVLIS